MPAVKQGATTTPKPDLLAQAYLHDGSRIDHHLIALCRLLIEEAKWPPNALYAFALREAQSRALYRLPRHMAQCLAEHTEDGWRILPTDAAEYLQSWQHATMVNAEAGLWDLKQSLLPPVLAILASRGA